MVAKSCTAVAYVATDTRRSTLGAVNVQEILGRSMVLVLAIASQPAIAKPHRHSQTEKSVDVKCKFVKESLRDRTIGIRYLPTGEMPADLMTKLLAH